MGISKQSGIGPRKIVHLARRWMRNRKQHRNFELLWRSSKLGLRGGKRMRTQYNFLRTAACMLALIGASLPAFGDLLPGMGQLSGTVSGSKPDLLTTVMARNTDNDVGFMVFVVDDKYRAVNLFPGNYEVTIKPAVGQLFTDGFGQQTKNIEIAANEHATLDFSLKTQKYEPDYAGGMRYKGGWSDAVPGNNILPPSPDAKVLPYEEIYPPGPGRDILERACLSCHTVQLFSYNHNRRYTSGRPIHDKAGWGINVDRMRKGMSFGKPNKQSYFDESLLTDKDRDILVDYLADNFGADSEPRAVQIPSEPDFDLQALGKAQFVEYRFANTEALPKRGTHHIGFTVDGNVWAMDMGGSLVWLDPRTGEHKAYSGHVRNGEGLVVDKDGSVWYYSNGLRHFDPKSNSHDQYNFEGHTPRAWEMYVSTLIFDSNGDLWLSFIGAGGIGKWERATDSLVWWDVPILRSRPYGITLDHNDKVWFANYHNSGIASFDPKTETFRNYRITDMEPTNIRRPGADSKNMIWTVTWGSLGMQEGALYRLNPETAEVDEYKLNIPYANPYDAAPDDDDNIWIATDNYLVMFDQETEKFTNYPLTVRSDVPRLAVTGEGAIWHGLRNAGHHGGYGSTAVALYPDKDNIKTYAATYSEQSNHSRLLQYDGPLTKVTGKIKISPAEPQNPGAYDDMLRSIGIEPTTDTRFRLRPPGTSQE
jgi:virginiamycin B lyase